MRIVAPKGWAQPWFLGNFWAKIGKKIFFSIFGIRMTQFAKKKQKMFFGLFDPWTCLGLAWACPWPKMASKWVKMNFPEHGVNRKVVDNGSRALFSYYNDLT